MPFRYGRIQKDEVNQLAVENYFSLIERAEQFYQDQLDVVVQDMGQSQSFDVICLSGPSSSGKTTTAKTLKRKFISRGRNARVISLDDFYLDVDRTPHLPDGSPDFETIYALDIPRINQCIKELIDHKRTIIPVFDFQRRARALEEKEIVVGEDDVVIIEGIHGLNPLLTELAGEDKITRIYVSARSKFVDQEEEILSPKDIRLMRRLVRDVATRNTPPSQTIAMWDNVCEGERLYINPYRDNANYKLDSTMDYEPNIFKNYLEPFFNQDDLEIRAYYTLRSLYERLDRFLNIQDTSPIPAGSVIREFIGKKKD